MTRDSTTRLHEQWAGSRARSRLVLLCAALCGASGCWSEVQYTGPLESQREKPSEQPIFRPAAEETAAATSEEGTAQRDTPQPLTDDLFGEVDSILEPSAGNAAPAHADTASYETENLVPAQPVGRQPRFGNTRHAAWVLGDDLSQLALAGDDRSTAARERMLEAEAAAQALGVTLPALPTRPASHIAETVLGELFPLGRAVGGQLARNQSPEHVALFEVAFKANLLLVLYTPDSQVVEAFAGSLESGALKAGLPDRLTRPLIDALVARDPAFEVDQQVQALQNSVNRFLTE